METSSNKSKGEAKESLSIPKSISKHLTPNKICTIMSIVAVIGLIISLSIGSGIPAMLFLLPSAIYQVIRTAGVSTKSASIVLLVSLAIELFLIIFNIQFDLGQYLGQDILLIGNSSVPKGDARIVLPFIMVIAAIILLIRTRGIYTKWLSIIIIVSVFGSLYIMFPDEFPELVKMVAKRIVSSTSSLLN